MLCSGAVRRARTESQPVCFKGTEAQSYSKVWPAALFSTSVGHNVCGLAKCQTCLSATRGLGILSLLFTPDALGADGVKLPSFDFNLFR